MSLTWTLTNTVTQLLEESSLGVCVCVCQRQDKGSFAGLYVALYYSTFSGMIKLPQLAIYIYNIYIYR